MFYRLGRLLSKIFFLLAGGYKFVGSQNIPKTGGVILAPNHISYLDPPLTCSGLRRQVHFMAKEELFKVPVLGMLIRNVGAFPVRRGTADRKALKRAIGFLEKGKVICIFPEGSRSPDGSLRNAVPGLGMIALKSGAPVVPVAIIGTDKVLGVESKRPRFHKVKIIYGEPLRFDDLDDSHSREAITEIGKRTMSSIKELLETNAE